MNKTLKVDLCIVGAGSGGLSVAAAAVQMGATVALVEKDKMGGDCLNYGCIPSKSLLAAARMAHSLSTAHQFGLPDSQLEISISNVMQKVQSVITTLAVNDSVARFEQLGVQVILSNGKFLGPQTLQAGTTLINAKHFVIATGSSPAIPSIPGIETVPYFTNETIFTLSENPAHLLIIGGGPIGCELAQAFLLLGIQVTVLEAFHILPTDDPELVKLLRQQLIADGLTLYEGVKITKITASSPKNITVEIEEDGKHKHIQASHILLATGRHPNIHDLNLEAAKVSYNKKGVITDYRLRTTNKKIYAIGDVTGSYLFTHIANYHAGIIIRNILFRLPSKVNYHTLPWVTYTQPELAHVGGNLNEILKHHPKAKLFTAHFTENDRAQTEHDTIGMIKVVTTAKGEILGVSILGPSAGELLTPWILAMQAKVKIRQLAEMIVPYPTLSEINKRIAAEFYKPLLISKKMRRIVRFLAWFN